MEINDIEKKGTLRCDSNRSFLDMSCEISFVFSLYHGGNL